MERLAILTLLALSPVGLIPAQIPVSGTVRNTENTPLPGVSVQLPNRTSGTVSGPDGTFKCTVQTAYDTLVFTLLGYQRQVLPLAGRNTLEVVLQEASGMLGEVVVIGFGTQERQLITGAVAAVGTEVFDHVSAPVFQRALQGQLPGVAITNGSGGPDAESILRIRGVGSISANNQPLVVIDGLTLSGLAGVESLGFLTNAYLGLNPSDIATVTVLKDAAATAIYGARASNGVILISTKNGRFEQPPRINLNYYAGFSEISKRRELLNGQEYATLWNQAARNTGRDTIPGLLYDISAQPNADWQDLILQRGFVQELNAGISGGTAANRYYIGAAYRDEAGYLITTGLKRFSLRLNTEQRLSKRLRAGILLNPTRTIDRRTGNQWAGSPFGWAAWYYPNVEALDANGNFRRDVVNTSNGYAGFAGNPGTVLKNRSIKTTTSQLLASLYLNWSILEGLDFKTELGIESSQVQEFARWYALAGFSGSGWQLQQQLFNYNWTNLFSWKKHWQNRHRLEMTVGTQISRENLEGSYISFSGFADDQLSYIGSAAQIDYKESWANDAAFAGFFTRANYSLKNRYLLALSARYDGSSRFGRNRRFGFFPALSAGWLLSEEDFFRVKAVDFLKIRSSIGLSGNSAINDFLARSQVSFEPVYNGQSGFRIVALENDVLGWEKCRQWNAGLEFSLWLGRLQGSLDYYIRDTKDLLLETPVPGTNGVTTLIQNAGAMRNQGFELSLEFALLRRKHVDWKIRFNGATLKNRILELADNNGDGLDDDFVLNQRMLYRTGSTAGSFFLVQFAGVNPANGDALFYDLTGNTTTVAPASNRQIVGKSLPGFTGGFSQTFRYRQFDLTAFFHFKTGHKIYLEEHALYNETNMSGTLNQLKSQLNAWTPENPITEVPQARLFEVNGSQPSTRYLSKADFIRLNHLELGYQFAGFRSNHTSLRLYLAAQNLLTITPFKGLDPDGEFYPSYSSALGAQRYNLPAARTYTLGLNANF